MLLILIGQYAWGCRFEIVNYITYIYIFISINGWARFAVSKATAATKPCSLSKHCPGHLQQLNQWVPVGVMGWQHLFALLIVGRALNGSRRISLRFPSRKNITSKMISCCCTCINVRLLRLPCFIERVCLELEAPHHLEIAFSVFRRDGFMDYRAVGGQWFCFRRRTDMDITV